MAELSKNVRSDESRHSCLVPDTKGKAFSLSLSSMWAVGFFIETLYQVEDVSSCFLLTENLYQDVGFCKMLFQPLLWWSYTLLKYGELHWFSNVEPLTSKIMHYPFYIVGFDLLKFCLFFFSYFKYSSYTDNLGSWSGILDYSLH